MERVFYLLAKTYVKIKKPQLIVVAGSVGKTSTKLTLAQLLSVKYKVSYMDESYNSGIGLPLSVFGLKTPSSTKNIFAWFWLVAKAKGKFLKSGPELMVLEYGIDSPGEMDSLLKMAKPDISFLTAVTPEHMEFLKDLDTVAKEETKIVKATKKWSMVNADYVDKKYRKNLSNVELYGKNQVNSYKISRIDRKGALVSFKAGDIEIKNIVLPIISEHLIGHTAGAVGVAVKLGLSASDIGVALKNLEPTPGRARLLEGVNGSSLIDDSVNFSPDAGVAALAVLNQFVAKRKIIVFGNMHELGDYVEEGFAEVSSKLGGFDVFIAVGPLARQYFVPSAKKHGYKSGKTLFVFEDSIQAGKFLRELLQPGDVALVKGPFGGYYLEECVKLALANPDRDARKLVRQKEYWPNKKRALFGDDFKEAK